MNMKRRWMAWLLIVVCGCSVNADDGKEYRSLSCEELDEKYAIKEDEKQKLEEMNIDVESFFLEGESQADDLIERMQLKDSDQHCLFLADGGVTCGKGQTITAYNEVLGKVKVVYDVDTDLNSLDWQETRYYLIQEHVRLKADLALGIEIEEE